MKAKEYPSQDMLNDLFEYKDGILYWKLSRSNGIKIGDLAGTRNNTGYWRIKIDGKLYLRHRLIYIIFNGNIQEGLLIDHINGIKGDDRIENLQLATNAENKRKQKMQSNNSSGFRGVSFHKSSNSYQAYIVVNRKNNHLGLFDNAEEAARAYDIAALNYFGEFANLNFKCEDTECRGYINKVIDG